MTMLAMSSSPGRIPACAAGSSRTRPSLPRKAVLQASFRPGGLADQHHAGAGRASSRRRGSWPGVELAAPGAPHLSAGFLPPGRPDISLSPPRSRQAAPRQRPPGAGLASPGRRLHPAKSSSGAPPGPATLRARVLRHPLPSPSLCHCPSNSFATSLPGRRSATSSSAASRAAAVARPSRR